MPASVEQIARKTKLKSKTVALLNESLDNKKIFNPIPNTFLKLLAIDVFSPNIVNTIYSANMFS